MRKIILFELNEVPFKVIDHYVEHQPQSILAKILAKSHQCVTQTNDHGHLHPWTTWPTLHRGISNEIHQIEDIGENLEELNLSHPPVWDILVKEGISTGVFSSLHTYPLPENVDKFNYFVPDPFAAGFETKPKTIEPFQAFNLMMSRASARNASRKINIKTGLLLLTTMMRIGIRFKSFADLFKQVIDERFEGWKTTRRRTYQSVLAFDIFYKLLKKNKPQFTTFFSNHAASTMHRYWAATFPEDYQENELGEEWINKYSGEIDFAMSKFDEFLSKLVRFVDENSDYKLIIASSMGQEATQAKSLSTELAVSDLDKLISTIGLDSAEWEKMPAMHPQYNVKVLSDSALSTLKSKLDTLIIDGKPISYRTKEGGFFSMDFGHVNLQDDNIELEGKATKLGDLGLHNEKIQEEATGTAYHVPEGSLIVYDPKKKDFKAERELNIDTRRVAPSLLSNFGVKVPDYMNEQLISSIAD